MYYFGKQTRERLKDHQYFKTDLMQSKKMPYHTSIPQIQYNFHNRLKDACALPPKLQALDPGFSLQGNPIC